MKETNPDIPVVWGGFHPTLLPNETIVHPLIDVVVRGQGEITFLDLVQHFERNIPPTDVLGITYKKEGKIFENPERSPIDVNDFPPIPYGIIDVQKYIMDDDTSRRTLDYISSRGCPYDCNFCEITQFYKRRWFALRPARVLDELEALVSRYKIEGVRFRDDNFFVEKTRVRRICDGIIERGLDISWSANCRCDYLPRFDKNLLGAMRESGCRTLFIGAESGSEAVLNMLNKRITVDQIVDSAGICHQYGISPEFAFMLGTPGEKMEDISKTLSVIDELYSMDPRMRIYLFIFTPYPGTPLYERALKQGFLGPRSLEEWSQHSYKPELVTWISDKDRKSIEEIALLSYFIFRPGYRASSGIRRAAFAAMRRVAMIRWGKRFFGLPVEVDLFRWLKKRGIVGLAF